jgi:gliding motility-associated protein GldC
MATSKILIHVETDENAVPEQITWTAEDGNITNRKAKAMALAMWDDADGVAMKMDLWTKEMSVEEMRQFTCQTLMTLADTFERSTSDKAHAEALRAFTKELAERLDVLQK